MRVFLKYVLIIKTVLLAPLLLAQTTPYPGSLGISGEWLFMLPAIDQPYYVVSTNAADTGPRIANEQKWKSGYRVEALYAFCNRMNDVRLRWTQFPSFSLSDSESGTSLFGILNTPSPNTDAFVGTASITDTFKFFYADLLFGQALVYRGPFALDVQAGFQYDNVKFNETVFYFTGTREVIFQSRICGFGPEIGAEFSYNLCRNFAVTGRAYAALLVSRRTSTYSDSEVFGVPGAIAATNDEKYWSVIPSTNIRFGLTWNGPLNLLRFSGPIGLDIEIGYEFLSFFDSVNRIYFIDTLNLGSSFDELMNLTLHGPYVHVGLTF